MKEVVILAHVGGIHAILYLMPVLIIMGGLWIAGRNLPEEDLDEFDEFDEFEDEGS